MDQLDAEKSTEGKIVRRGLSGLASLAVIYFIFSTDLSSGMKNLLLGLICTGVLAFYIVAARYRSRVSLTPATLALAAPTLLWMAVLIPNAIFAWGIPTWALWTSYALLTLGGYIVSAKLETV